MTSHFVTIVHKYKNISQKKINFHNTNIHISSCHQKAHFAVKSTRKKERKKERNKKKEKKKETKDLTNERSFYNLMTCTTGITFSEIFFCLLVVATKKQFFYVPTITLNQVIIITNNCCKSKTKTTIPCVSSN